MALGATGDVNNAKIAGEIIGSELSSLGINTTLAPVVDVNNNANNPVIGYVHMVKMLKWLEKWPQLKLKD